MQYISHSSISKHSTSPISSIHLDEKPEFKSQNSALLSSNTILRRSTASDSIDVFLSTTGIAPFPRRSSFNDQEVMVPTLAEELEPLPITAYIQLKKRPIPQSVLEQPAAAPVEQQQLSPLPIKSYIPPGKGSIEGQRSSPSSGPDQSRVLPRGAHASHSSPSALPSAPSPVISPLRNKGVQQNTHSPEGKSKSFKTGSLRSQQPHGFPDLISSHKEAVKSFQQQGQRSPRGSGTFQNLPPQDCSLSNLATQRQQQLPVNVREEMKTDSLRIRGNGGEIPLSPSLALLRPRSAVHFADDSISPSLPSFSMPHALDGDARRASFNPSSPANPTVFESLLSRHDCGSTPSTPSAFGPMTM